MITACPPHYYGNECNASCGYCGGNAACDNVTGQCRSGCMADWHGVKCDCKYRILLSLQMKVKAKQRRILIIILIKFNSNCNVIFDWLNKFYSMHGSQYDACVKLLICFTFKYCTYLRNLKKIMCLSDISCRKSLLGYN